MVTILSQLPFKELDELANIREFINKSDLFQLETVQGRHNLYDLQEHNFRKEPKFEYKLG